LFEKDAGRRKIHLAASNLHLAIQFMPELCQAIKKFSYGYYSIPFIYKNPGM